MNTSEQLLSIGALSKATGVPVETLRTWERRYGFPVAERTQSGHRRYSLETLERLRLVTQVLSLGHRPGAVLGADEAALRALLPGTGGTAERAEEGAVSVKVQTAGSRVLERWFEHVERFESRAFDRELRSAFNDLGVHGFLETCAGPFVRELGKRWSRQQISVAQEHFAAERMREFLTGQWRPLSDAATGSTYVLTTLAGERHVLGLHFVALTVAMSGGRVLFLGADSPVEEIAAAVAYHAAAGVLLSAAAGYEPDRLREQLAALRRAVPPSVPIIAGGRGVSADVPGVKVMQSFRELERWLTGR